MDFEHLRREDEEIYAVMEQELTRQRDHIELIASENFTSPAVMEAVGSHLTNKYAEGYPGKRYYGGCEHVDVVEEIARQRACELFGAEHANVQPHSGSQANVAVYLALTKPGDVLMGMDLSCGGHLTHGSKASITGKYFDVRPYGVDRETELIDYDALLAQAKELRPKMIISGASAYSRIIDWKRIREICDEVGAYMFVDMAHIGGLVAAGGAHPLQGGAGQEDRLRHLPRHPGRPAHARHRRQGRLPQGGHEPRFCRIPAPGGEERRRALRHAPGRRHAHSLRWHG